MSSPSERQGEYFKAVFTVDIVPEAEREKFRNLSRPETYRRIRPHYRVGQRGCYEVEVTPREFTLAMRDALNPGSNLIAAQRPQTVYPHSVPNAANNEYVGLRDLDAHGYTGAGVVVGVIDGGLPPALRDGVFAGRVEAAESFIDSQPHANTYIHGSQMAGLAVPDHSHIAVAKVFSDTTFGTDSDVTEAVYWCVDEAGADVINLSLGHTGSPFVALSDACEYAASNGVLVFASMGNDGNATVQYPAAYDGVMGISSFDHRTDAISATSSYGPHTWAAAGGRDHTEYNEAGREFSDEDAGTSGACAMASRVAAFALSSGLSPSAAKSQLASTARDAGAPSNKQGAGVLQLVKVYEKPDGDEPAVPVVPVGQSRDFDLELPELPPIDGPGSEEDPSNPTDPTAPVCNDATLNSLVAAYQTSGSTPDRDALIDYVEAQTGQAIEDLLQPEWDETASDGVPRTKTVSVGACDVEFTVDATLVAGGGCALGTKTMALPEHDYSFSTLVLGDFPDPPTEPPVDPIFYDPTYSTMLTFPEATCHVQDPKMVYLNVASTRSGDLMDKWDLNVDLYDSIGHSVIQIKVSYTTEILKTAEYTWDIPTAQWHTSTSWSAGAPPIGFRSLIRFPEGVFSTEPKYYTDPLEIGYIVSPGSAFSDDYFTNDSSYMHHPAGGVNASGTPATIAANFQSAVNSYNASRTTYDPVITYDSGAGTITVSMETDDNAIYLQGPQCSTSSDRARAAVTVLGGGWVADPDYTFTRDLMYSRTPGYQFDGINAMIQRIVQSVDEEYTFYENTPFYDRQAEASYTASVELDADTVPTGSTDGRPPDTEPNPPITPVGGGCKSSVDGPSSCTWTLPDNGDIPLPGDNFDDMPVINTNFPKFPPIGCHFPDFGNMDPCAPGSGPPGMNGPGPGGRDKRGKRGNKHGHVKTGGPTYGNPRKVSFDERTCFGQDMPGISCFTVITMLLMDCGISALDIIFQVTSEYDKPFPEAKCFRKGALKWDAANWTARYLGLHIFDEGKPTNNVYIGPRYHRPGQSTWHFWEHIDFFGYDPVNSSEELYSAVVVFGPDGLTATSLVESPFTTDDYPIKYVEVGPNFSQADANLLAAYHASLVRREATSVQVVVPYSNAYFLRDKAVLHAPDRGFETNWIIMGKESDISETGRLHHLTLMLPETVRELDELPTSVGTVAEETPGTDYLPS